MTLCPGGQEPMAIGRPSHHDLAVDLQHLRQWKADIMISLTEPDVMARLNVADSHGLPLWQMGLLAIFCYSIRTQTWRNICAGDVSLNNRSFARHSKMSQHCLPLFTFANLAF
jgi:hypothetical protein